MENNQLFDWLGRRRGWRSAVEAGRGNPVLVATVQKSAELFEQIPLKQFIDRDTVDRLARQFYLEINSVCNAADPLMVGREKLAGTMLRFARYQVLTIPSAPAKDASGLRGLPGISGEFRPHLDLLAQKNIALRSELHESEYFNRSADLWTIVQAEYWKSYWLLETLNAARMEMRDVIQEHDWYRPFMHAACANQENLYRIDLDLPSAFDELIARSAPSAYSIFTDIVISGAQDPLAQWHDYHSDTRVPAPGSR